MFRVKVIWEQTSYYEAVVVTDAPPGTDEWWRDVWKQNLHAEAVSTEDCTMRNIVFIDEEIV